MLLIQSVANPLALRFDAEAFVKIDRWLVPIEHGPFETPAAFVVRDFEQFEKNALPNAASAQFRFDEQIFEVKARFGQPGGVGIKIHRETSGLVILEGEQGGGFRVGTEERIANLISGGYALVFELFVAGELLDEIEDKWAVGGSRGADKDFGID